MRVTMRSLVLASTVALATTVASTAAPIGAAAGHKASSCFARAQHAAVRAEAAPPMVLPTQKINLPSLKGKSVWLINALPIPELVDIANGFSAAATEAGLKPMIVNTTGTVTSWTDAVSQAVSQGAAGIVLLAVPWELASQPLQQAAAAKIPVVQFSDGGPQNAPGSGVYAHVTFDNSIGGRYMADWVLADSACHASVGYLNPVPTSPAPTIENGFETELKRLCRVCKVTAVDVPLATLSTVVPTTTQSLIRRVRGLNYLVPTFDSLVTYAAPSLAQAGSKAKIIAHDGASANLASIVSGNSAQKADVALAPSAFQGWVLLDYLARGMLQLPAPPPYAVAQRLIVKKNAKSSDSALFPSFAAYQRRFLALWELQ